MTKSIPESNNLELLLWIFRQRKRFRVTGKSMLPLLKPDDEVLVDYKAYKKNSPQLEDIVVAKHPYQNNLKLIKRVKRVGNNSYFLQGDNEDYSTDSRHFGEITLKEILGKVICFFP